LGVYGVVQKVRVLLIFVALSAADTQKVFGVATKNGDMRCAYFNSAYKMCWALAPTTISFSVQVQGVGFVGLGVSPISRGMSNADIWIANFTGASIQAGDYYRPDSSPGMPTPDVYLGGENNIYFVTGVQQNGVTVFNFTRDLLTDDIFDHAIVAGMNDLIWSYGTSNTIGYHQDKRGQAELDFVNGEYVVY